MTEHDTPQVAEASNEALARSSAREAAERAFEAIDFELTELVDAAQHEAVKEQATALIDQLQISPELFGDKGHALFFMALAKRLSEASPDDIAEREFVHDATMLLAQKHSSRYEAMKDAINSDEDNESELLAVHEKFTNHELTARLDAALRGGLLEGVRGRLHVTDDNEDSYEVRVLNLGEDYSLGNFQPSSSDDMTPEALDVYEKQWAEYKAYQETMLGGLAAFKREAGIEGHLPIAWKTTLEGKTQLCIPHPVAREILDKDAVVAKWYTHREYEGDNSDESRTLALIEHEYTHTQGGVALDNGVFYGITAEEVRAENASGNKHGYQDAKQFMRQVGILTGFNVTEYFNANVKGGEENFFSDMASVVGIDAALEIALVPPRIYIDETRKLQQAVDAHLGGYNGVLKRIYERSKHDPAVQERIAAYRKTIDSFDPNVRETWIAMQNGSHQMPFVAELYTN